MSKPANSSTPTHSPIQNVNTEMRNSAVDQNLVDMPLNSCHLHHLALSMQEATLHLTMFYVQIASIALSRTTK